MNKKQINLITIIIILVFLILLFQNYYILSEISINVGKIFIIKVFPFLFIMMVINNLLINLNFPYYLSRIIKTPALYTMILSMLSGSPLNAIIINNFLEQKDITTQDASIILAFTSFNNPLFLYSYFNLIFPNKITVIKLFAIIYLANIIIYFLLKKKLTNNPYQSSYQTILISQALTNSIKTSCHAMISIFGTIFFFFLLSNIVFKTNSFISVISKGLIEITQGLNSILILNTSYKIKELLVLVILQFQGLSIHMQISTILSKYTINYKYFYLSRILLILISLGLKMIW